MDSLKEKSGFGMAYQVRGLSKEREGWCAGWLHAGAAAIWLVEAEGSSWMLDCNWSTLARSPIAWRCWHLDRKLVTTRKEDAWVVLFLWGVRLSAEGQSAVFHFFTSHLCIRGVGLVCVGWGWYLGFCTASCLGPIGLFFFFFFKPQTFGWPSEPRARTAWAQKKPTWSHYKAILLYHGQVFHFDKWRYQIQDASLDFMDFVLLFPVVSPLHVLNRTL